MDLFQAIKERRSCRNFDSRPIEEEKLQAVLEAGSWAPSAMNKQPWRFLVIKNQERRQRLRDACDETRKLLFELSGWKWLSRYSIEFLVTAPVIIAVYADPQDSGADLFLPERGDSYAQGCCAAVQNMLLAAHALGLGSLWYTLYEKERVMEILELPLDYDLVSMVVLGYPAQPPGPVPRKPVSELTTVMN